MVENFDLKKQLEEIKVNFITSDIEKSGDILGIGTFGKVHKGTYKGDDVAIKELTFEDNPDYSIEEVVRDIINEIKAFYIVEKLHPAIVRFYGVWMKDNKICFVFEMIKGKDLY